MRWNRFTRAATLSVMSCARLALSPLLMLLFAACASAPDPAATPTVQGPLLGRPCPMPSEQGEGDGAQHPTRVFVEVGARGSQAGSWRVAHVLASERTAATIPWYGEQGAETGSEPETLTVVPHLSQLEPGHVRLDVSLTEAPHAGPSDIMKTSLVLRDQQLAVLQVQATPSRSAQTISIAPYLIRGDADLRSLLQCKLQARAEAVGDS